MTAKREANPKAEILVDGAKVPANPFVQEIIGASVLAMVRQLKRTPDEPATVEIKVTVGK